MFNKFYFKMKKRLIQIITIAIVSIMVSRCSKSSDEPTPIILDDTVPTTCMPLKTLNFWNYTVENRVSANAPASTFTDKLNVGNDVIQNMITYKEMYTTFAPNGFFSSMLSNNKLRIDGTRLKVTGTFTNNIIPNVNVAVSLVDFIILKDNASAGTALSSQSGQVVQTISGYPVTFDYTFKSIAEGTLASFTSNGVTYNNVKKTKIVLTATATTIFQGVFSTVLLTQDVIVSNLYFVPNQGMIYNNRVFNYTINPGIAAQLQVPATASQVQEEFIGTFNVSN